MKIIFISYHYWPAKFGGELLASIERFESLAKKGHEVIVYTSGFFGLANKELINLIEINRSPRFFDSKIGRGLRRLFFPIWVSIKIASQKRGILHLAGTGGVGPLSHYFGNIMVCLVAKINQNKIVWVHSLADTEKKMFTDKGFEYKIRNLFLQFVDKIISVSPALHNSVNQHFPSKSELIIYGIRDDIFVELSDDERNNFREKHSITKNDVIFSFLGTISERKGFDLLLKAYEELRIQFPNWKLWVIGPRSYVENQNITNHTISTMIKPLEKYKDSIYILGRIDDRNRLAKFLGSSDVFVFPSRKEGMGIAPLEAMATGIPVIISRIPDVTDLANIHGQTGMYFELGDLDGLKEAMINLGTEVLKRKEMGKKAHDRIKDHFNWEKHIREWEEFYFNLINIT